MSKDKIIVTHAAISGVVVSFISIGIAVLTKKPYGFLSIGPLMLIAYLHFNHFYIKKWRKDWFENGK